jgi:hypothetical protein
MRRREFLQAAAVGLAGLPLLGKPSEVSCILLMLVGGPSQLDTWDMKPEVPSEYRGPFRPIRTNVPGMEISEIFPRMARHADKYALIRSVYHDGPSFHDSGHQLMQTGRLHEDLEHPHPGSVLSMLQGAESVVLPFPIGNTGGNMTHGQGAGYLGQQYAPRFIGAGRHTVEAASTGYGNSQFGRSCLTARKLVESGTRFVTVNMFETVFGETTWDIHGSAPFSPISCYRDQVGPMFDQGYSALLEDLSQRGMLSTTLVVAMGEFGRSPKINPSGGRDHWPLCSTIVMAGGGIRGGQIYGSSDRMGAEPKDDPVNPAMVAATIYSALGVQPGTILPGPDGRCIPVVEPGARPITALFS